MPLQNRVTPFGEIVAVPDHGMFMGNRGCLHDDQRRIVRQYCSYRAWVACLTSFNGRKRELMKPGFYTELFFLDEATALAAGHRPCGECRRDSFRRFKAAWLKGNCQADVGSNPPIKLIDGSLHQDRLTAEGTKRIYEATMNDVPDGTFVRPHDWEGAFLLWHGRLHHWTPGGYDRSHPAEPDEIIDVLTPRSIVNALRAGYVPEVQPSAG